jgi:putative endonuclease
VTTALAPSDKDALGLLGERIAERFLAERGWATLGRRVRSGHRDLDLVMERDGVVAFVEVKARRGEGYGGPTAAVDWRKRRELVRSALVWMDRFGDPAKSYRFDVIGIVVSGGRAKIRHVAGAFELRGRH